MASTSGNMQAYSVIVTKSEKVKNQLYKPHFEQEMVKDAPILLTFCADFHRMRRWLRISEAPENFDNFMSFLIAAIDAILVSQNVALAAESEGLGICYMGTTLASCLEIAKILQCPDHVVPIVGFSLGYPAETPPMRQRLPMEAIVHSETYQELSDQELLRHYAKKERSGFTRYSSDESLSKLIKEYGAKNLAQIYTKVKYTRESHIKYSEDVLGCLQSKGFLGQ
jgi:hypothetical protein